MRQSVDGLSESMAEYLPGFYPIAKDEGAPGNDWDSSSVPIQVGTTVAECSNSFDSFKRKMPEESA